MIRSWGAKSPVKTAKFAGEPENVKGFSKFEYRMETWIWLHIYPPLFRVKIVHLQRSALAQPFHLGWHKICWLLLGKGCGSPYLQPRYLHSIAALDNLRYTCCLDRIQEPAIETYIHESKHFHQSHHWEGSTCSAALLQKFSEAISSKPSLWRAFSSWINPHISGSSWTLFLHKCWRISS